MASQPTRKHNFLKSVAEFAAIIVVVAAAKTAIAEPFYIPSGSMEPTLLIGDELLANKYAYGYGTASLPSFIVMPNTTRIMGDLPKRGDIVVFRWPGDWGQAWVKRVIGLPGDHVALRDGHLIINGEPVALRPAGDGQSEGEDGEMTQAARFIETLPGNREHAIFKFGPNRYDNFPETVVPSDHLFVMGDNRDNSADSRVPLREGGVGMLPVGNLIGRVSGIVGSWDLGVKSQPVWQWPSGLRLARFFSSVQ